MDNQQMATRFQGCELVGSDGDKIGTIDEVYFVEETGEPEFALLSKAGAKGDAATIGIAGGVALVAILLVSYYAGGYVAGRLARFDGVRQGLGVWLLGVFVTLAFAAAGATAGSQYNVLNRLNLPNVPVGRGAATTGGVVAVAAALVATLVAAAVGGKIGEQYHRKIDRVGTRTPPGATATRTQVSELDD